MPKAPTFEQWLLLEQERFVRLAAENLEALMRDANARNAPDDALRFARVAAVTAVQEPEISDEAQRRLHDALRMIVRIAHAAGSAGVDVQLDG